MGVGGGVVVEPGAGPTHAGQGWDVAARIT